MHSHTKDDDDKDNVDDDKDNHIESGCMRKQRNNTTTEQAHFA